MKNAGKLTPSEFFDSFPAPLKNLLDEVLQEGFSLTMVGGAVRDFFLTNTLPKDIDIELRLEVFQEEEEWKKTICILGQKLKEHYDVEFLPFGIIRIHLNDMDVEFSSPRTEKYSEKGPWGHSDFEAILSSSLTQEQSFSRRDFTMNAIGIEFQNFETFKIHDPFKGLSDLKAKVLRFCGEDFYKDPVRFLRLVRMQKRFDFSLAPELQEMLPKFDLTLLKPFHFSVEAFKAGFSTFLSRFFELVDEHNIQINPELLFYKAFVTEGTPYDQCANFQDLFVVKVFEGKCLEPDEDFEKMAQKVGMKQHFLSQLYEFKKVLLSFQRYPLKKLKKEVQELMLGEQWQNVIGDERFVLMERFCFYERRLSALKQSFAKLFTEELHDLYLELLTYLPPELRGEEEFINLIQSGQVPQELKSVLRIYTHFSQAKNS